MIEKGERDVARQYAHVLVEIRKQLADQYEKFEQDGKLTIEEMTKHNRLKKLMKEVNHLLRTNRYGVNKMIEKILGDAYLEGYYLTAWAVEENTQAKLGYSAVSPETLAAMITNPVAGLTLNERLERNRAMLVYKIQQEVTQGLQNNETYSKMAKRLKKELEGNAVKAMRIVRTEGHRVQESAKHDAAEHANKNGVIMTKTWNSLEDSRVRKTKDANHRRLNNTTIAVDDDFRGVSGRGPAPGQLGEAAEDINCRCFLTYSVERVEKPKHDELEDMTFNDWKKDRLRKS